MRDGNAILYLAAAILMSLPVLSCRSTSHNTHTYRPYHERRNRNIDAPNDENNNKREEDKFNGSAFPSGIPLVSDEWARLDVKPDHKKNKPLYRELKRWLGTPYAHAKQNVGEGTDCSGMVMMVFKQVYGIQLSRNSAKMLELDCQQIDVDELREGDLVFFCTNGNGRVSHVGIYLKDNKFVHASTSRGVTVDDLRQNYYTTHFHSAGRVKTRSR